MGAFGGLKEALNNESIIFTVKYQFRYPLSIFKSNITDVSIINIKELEALPATTGSVNEQLGKIQKELSNLNKEFSKKFK